MATTTRPPHTAVGLRLPELVAVAGLVGSGALGLCYEIVWIRKASLVFGAASFALSTVLAVFFGGLALGSFCFGRIAPRLPRPLRVYGLLEIGVGLLAIATPAAFAAVDRVYEALYPELYERFALLSLLRLAGTAAVLLPPTFLMGGTLPLFCQHFVRRAERISLGVGLLYGLNTLGAAGGAALCGFLLIPELGVERTIRVAAAANAGIGTVIALLPVRAPARARPASHASPGEPRSPHDVGRLVPALFFGTGFVALANEVLWARYLSLLMSNTVYTYTITLTVVLLGIVIGSLIGGAVFDRLGRRGLAFGLLQVTGALVVTATLLLPERFLRGFVDPRTLDVQIAIALVVLLPAAVLSGSAFPLAIRMVLADPARAGPAVGRMAALNTAGGIAGSLVTGFAILPRLGLRGDAGRRERRRARDRLHRLARARARAGTAQPSGARRGRARALGPPPRRAPHPPSRRLPGRRARARRLPRGRDLAHGGAAGTERVHPRDRPALAGRGPQDDADRRGARAHAPRREPEAGPARRPGRRADREPLPPPSDRTARLRRHRARARSARAPRTSSRAG